MVRVPELLAPAGNLEKLKVAVHYGADAVYLGGEEYSLRSLADNFTLGELVSAVDYAHGHGVKVYLATNIFARNGDLEGVERFLRQVAGIPFDACIVADPGVLELVREVSPDWTIHLSTQANTTNWRSVRFWERQGVSRVNLARELSLTEIRAVKERSAMELEVFVHGAMCISYSGRCLLSSVMTGRDANKGGCAHPCRWGYALVEEQRPGQFFPVVENDRGTFIFNAKDLCLLANLPDLIGAGVDSLKIEGRMKGVHYVASVVRVYREALDCFRDAPDSFTIKEAWLKELQKISHRGYTTGFLLGSPGADDHEYQTEYVRSHDFVGIVEDLLDDGAIIVEARNRVNEGDVVEFVGRGMTTQQMVLAEIITTDGKPLPVVHPNQRFRLQVPFTVERFDLLRREKEPEK
jgi:U32 family peptidase